MHNKVFSLLYTSKDNFILNKLIYFAILTYAIY